MPQAAPDPSPPGRATALFAARTAAWALLFGGWIVLGALGARHAPAALGPLAPVALWLLALGIATRVSAAWRPARFTLRVTVLVAASVTAVALAWPAAVPPAWSWAIAALAWAVLLVAASRVVRVWRLSPGPRPPSPVVPAALGALLAWAVAGDPLATIATPAGAALALLALGGALAALVPAAGSGPRAAAAACRSGLFDCALSWPTLAQWRYLPDWPWLAASLAMLPMMAALPLMAEGCARAGWPVHAATGLHLLAMLAPALLLTVRSRRPAASTLRAGIAVLLVAGAAAAVTGPGVTGAMTAMALQSAAWGLGWSVALRRGSLATANDPTAWPNGGPAASTLAAAAAVTALGLLFAAAGLGAWTALHLVLGALAAAGLAAGAWRGAPLLTKDLAR